MKHGLLDWPWALKKRRRHAREPRREQHVARRHICTNRFKHAFLETREEYIRYCGYWARTNESPYVLSLYCVYSMCLLLVVCSTVVRGSDGKMLL
jgi:hypothetical protein